MLPCISCFPDSVSRSFGPLKPIFLFLAHLNMGVLEFVTNPRLGDVNFSPPQLTAN